MYKPSILVVDDEPNNFDVIEAILRDQDYEVNYASSGQESLESLEILEIDLILLDVMMPDIDGIEVCERIKAIPKYRPIPIIMVTALSAKEDLAQCLNAGADDFISKPVNALELRARVQSMLRIKQQHEELQDAKEAAEAALRIKSDFLAMMSHEIRTPINGVLGMTQLLFTTSLGSDQQKYLNGIQTSGELLLAVINDILDFSKFESGKLALEQIPLNLHQLAADICALLSRQAEAKGILLSLQIDEGVPPFILGDSIRLRQILLNLANNAVKFTDSGSVEVKISLQSSETVPLLFSVTDTGIGISTEALQKLFQPFIQASISTTRKYGGTGLGLAICQKLIQIMGGKIWAESTSGKGSTFSFALPMLLAEAIPENVMDSPTPLELRSDFAQQFPHRILVAEDNLINQELIFAMLGKLGYVPKIVNDGLEAIEALQQMSYTLLFLDVQMPRMDGLETATYISEHWQEIAVDRPRPIVIAMTASTMQGDREKCLEAGMDDYISKPIFFDVLQRIISSWSMKSSAIPLVSQESIISQELTGVFEPNALIGLKQYSPDLPKRVIHLFQSQEAPHLFEVLRKALVNKDVSQIEFAAHSLKGSSSMLGAISFSQQCHTIEVAGGKQQLDGIELLFDRLEKEYKLVSEYLEAYLYE